MNNDQRLNDNDLNNDQIWPRKLNKALIGFGVIAFGLIIADRIVSIFIDERNPEPVAIERTDNPGDTRREPDAGLSASVEDTAATEAQAEPSTDSEDTRLGLEEVFGRPLVFVSASEPLYVLTDDNQRFEVGSSIDEQTTLAGITGQRVILERSGELLVIDLPEPGVN